MLSFPLIYSDLSSEQFLERSKAQCEINTVFQKHNCYSYNRNAIIFKLQ